MPNSYPRWVLSAPLLVMVNGELVEIGHAVGELATPHDSRPARVEGPTVAAVAEHRKHFDHAPEEHEVSAPPPYRPALVGTGTAVRPVAPSSDSRSGATRLVVTSGTVT